MSIETEGYACVDCNTIGIIPYQLGDGQIRCELCAKIRYQQLTWGTISGNAAEIIINMNDHDWQDENSWFKCRLARLCRRHGHGLVMVIKADETGQTIRVGKSRNGFGVTSYTDIIRTIRRPWPQASYDKHKRLAGSHILGS